MEEDDSDRLFGFHKTTASPLPPLRASSNMRTIRPQSHTPINPPPISRRLDQRPWNDIATSVDQSSFRTSGLLTSDQGRYWPNTLLKDREAPVKRHSTNSREDGRADIGAGRVTAMNADLQAGQKRPNAIADDSFAASAMKRPKIEPVMGTPTLSRALSLSRSHLPSSMSKAIKEEPDVNPTVVFPKKTAGPFMVDSDSDSDSDSDKGEGSFAATFSKVSSPSSSRQAAGIEDVQAQKEAQRLTSERLRREALERKNGATASCSSAGDRIHSRASFRGPRQQLPPKKQVPSEPVTIDLCSDSEDAVTCAPVQEEDGDDWLKGSKVFGEEDFGGLADEDIVVAGGKKEEVRDRQKGSATLFGWTLAKRTRAHEYNGVKKLGFSGELKKPSEQAHSINLHRERIPTTGNSDTDSVRQHKSQTQAVKRRHDETIAQQRADSLAVAKIEQDRKAREDRQRQENEAPLAREADERKAAERRRQERHRREAEETVKKIADEEKQRAEERRACQQKLVEQEEAKIKYKSEQQAKYEKFMAQKRQEAVAAEKQRNKDREALEHWRKKEKEEEEARRAALAEQRQRSHIQQDQDSHADEAAKARHERIRALQERNARNKQAEDEVELKAPEIEALPAINAAISTRAPVSLNSAAVVQRSEAVLGLSASRPGTEGPVSLNSADGDQKLRSVQTLSTWKADSNGSASLNSLAGQAGVDKSMRCDITPPSATGSFDSGYLSAACDSSGKELDRPLSVNIKKPAPAPQVEDPMLRAQVGEVLPEDIKVVVWRFRKVEWSQIIGELNRTGEIRSENSLRRRYEQVSEVLNQIKLKDENLLDLVEKGDRAACEELNRTIHGTWPLPPTLTTSRFGRNGMCDTVLDNPKFKKKLGEVLPMDIKIYQWAESGAPWVDIASSYNHERDDTKKYSTLKRRYDLVAKALKAVNLSKHEIEKVAKGDMNACEHLNRTIHGCWPIHAAMHIDTSKPHFLKKLGEITGDDIALMKMRDAGMTWEAVSSEYYGLTKKAKDKGTLRSRYEYVTAALHDHPEIEQDLLDRLVGNKDEKAKEEVNRAVHGAWPIPKLPAVTGSVPHNNAKSKTGALSLKRSPLKPSRASCNSTGLKLTRDITEDDCKLLKWRDQGMGFGEIGEILTVKPNSLQSRYNNLKATLDNVFGVDKEMIAAVAVGNKDALQSLNYLVQQTDSDNAAGVQTRPSSERPDSAMVASSPRPASRSDGRPSVGGKSLDLAMAQGWKDWLEAAPETEEPGVAEREDSPERPDDYCHLVYTVLRREWKAPQTNEDVEEVTIEDTPWVVCGHPYETLSEANNAATKQVFRAQDPELRAYIRGSRKRTLEEEPDENDLYRASMTIPEGRVDVHVERRPRTFKEGIAPASKEGWISRTCWRIQEKRVTFKTKHNADGDDAEGLFSEAIKETETVYCFVNDTTYTLLEIANLQAVEYWMQLSWDPTDSNTNLRARQAAREEQKREYLDELEVTGNNAHFEAECEDGGSLEIDVVPSSIKGPRNIMV